MAKLYPPIRPYRKGYLKVSGGHELYYELCGNPKGKPVLYLHGGPGAGILPKAKRYFNPKVYNIVLFDQRGSGKSRPFASTKNNTTQKLIDDIRKLLEHLGIRKTFLFGGSWGATLALAYAIRYPKTVTGMLLRGVFLCDSGDMKDFFGGGTADHFPEVWERFIGNVPKSQRKNLIDYYARQMKSKNKKTADKYAREWARLEIAMLKLDMPEKEIQSYLKDKWYRSLAPLEAHYLRRLCFMPDGYLLKNAHRLSGIPTVIVHGRYDFVCRPINAYRLHKLIKGSKLYLTVAAHASSEKANQDRMIEEMDKFAMLRN